VDDLLYHYTERAFALEVYQWLTSDPYEYWFRVEHSGSWGDGLYALDVPPGAASPDELRYLCFNDWRPDHLMDGVLVLDATVPPPFVQVDPVHSPNIFLLEAELDATVSLGERVLAVGLRTDLAWSICCV
jgi:hypothetical protein